jgi:hypothetical protein
MESLGIGCDRNRLNFGRLAYWSPHPKPDLCSWAAMRFATLVRRADWRTREAKMETGKLSLTYIRDAHI